MRVIALASVLLGLVLAPLAAALAASDRAHDQAALVQALTTTAHDEAAGLSAYFARARSVDLLTAHNPGFVDFYRTGGKKGHGAAHEAALAQSVGALDYLERLYRTSISEACFIDAAGPENARVVRGHRATTKDLSPDESGHGFFQPTFELPAGQVYQAPPYISGDTHEWVISNSTVVPMPGGSKPAIVHFEVTIESFRREAVALGGKFGLVVVDARTGDVVLDRDRPQRRLVPLGVPSDRRFVGLTRLGAAAGVMDVGGHKAGYERLTPTRGNANDWIVVALSRTPTPGFLSSFGALPLALLLTAFGLLATGMAGLALARRRLTAFAHTDALTGLSNRRKLDDDLTRACARATTDEPWLFALFDLNGFKPYNDTFGHAAGDVLLARLGTALSIAVGAGVQAYRLGGDEFCVLASPAVRDHEALLARAGLALSEQGEGFSINASHGSLLLPLQAATAKEALAIADQRMYAQKQRGRPSEGQQSAAVLLQALCEREPELGEHLDDVAALARQVATQLGLPPAQVEVIEKAARLHDVGKVAIPEAILRKPTRLDAEEWTFMRRHTVIGERIVNAAPALAEVGQLIRSSHERWDGDGYPDRLAGEDIPLGARIVGVCDAYDAIVSARPYAPRRTHAEAIAELRRCSATQFDPSVVDALIAVLEDVTAAAA
jgi:diguanylate cyclase (GGDEF)-like protein